MRSIACTAAFALLFGFAAVAPRARAAGADGDWSSRRSSHFELFQDVAIERYSGRDGSRAFERDLLEVLESAHDRLRDAISGDRPGF